MIADDSRVNQSPADVLTAAAEVVADCNQAHWLYGLLLDLFDLTKRDVALLKMELFTPDQFGTCPLDRLLVSRQVAVIDRDLVYTIVLELFACRLSRDVAPSLACIRIAPRAA